MRNLTGDHVHLVGEGHGNQHVGIFGAGPRKCFRVRGETDDPLDVQAVCGGLNECRRRINDRHVVLLLGQAFGNSAADPSRTANDDLHECSCPIAATKLRGI